MKKTLIIVIFSTTIATFRLANSITFFGNNSSQQLQNNINNSNFDGTLDQTFGNNHPTPGINVMQQGIISNENSQCDEIYAIALQSDGKIVTTGFGKDANGYNHFTLARYLSNGTLDPLFGATNSTTTSIIPGTVFINGFIAEGRPESNCDDRAYAITIQLDGKIIVGGYSIDTTGNYAHFALARFMPDGSLDATFGNNAEGTTSLIPGTVFISNFIVGTGQDVITSLAILQNGKIVTGGSTNSLNNAFFALAQFMPNGSLDDSFGVAAEYTGTTTPGTVYISSHICTEGPNDLCNRMIIAADGTIILAGLTEDAARHNHFALAAFTQEGSLLSTFGQTVEYSTTSNFSGTVYITDFIIEEVSRRGKRRNGLGDGDNIFGIALQNDGKIVVGGFSIDHGEGFYSLARFMPNGTLDPSFGFTTDNTISNTPGTLYVNTHLVSNTVPYDELFALNLQNDGKIVTMGLSSDSSYVYGSNYSYFSGARFLPNGTLDASFGNNASSSIPGTFYLPNLTATGVTGLPQPLGCAMQPDGSIIVAGSSGPTTTVPQYYTIMRLFNQPNFASYQATYTTVGAGLNC